MITVLIPAGARVDDVLELDGDESHHLKVRRASEGPVALRDGAGLVGEGELQVGRRIVVRVVRVTREPPPPPLVLGVGAGDRDRFALLAEKAAELAVTRLVPLETERSRSVAGSVRASHADRLRRRALDALKQSGGAWAPEVSLPAPIDRFLRTSRQPDEVRLIAAAGGAAPPAWLPPAAPVSVLVGPEGGLTDDERAAAADAGYLAVALGPRVLRFETAAIAAAAAVLTARQRGGP